jgi:hypothetical protein
VLSWPFACISPLSTVCLNCPIDLLESWGLCSLDQVHRSCLHMPFPEGFANWHAALCDLFPRTRGSSTFIARPPTRPPWNRTCWPVLIWGSMAPAAGTFEMPRSWVINAGLGKPGLASVSCVVTRDRQLHRQPCYGWLRHRGEWCLPVLVPTPLFQPALLCAHCARIPYIP